MLSWTEVAQPMCDDPVVAAAIFKPNASGWWELASLRALSERQLLKGAGTYLAERVLIAVTTVEVAAIDVGVLGQIRHQCRRWRRDEVAAKAVINRDGRVPLPALALASRYGRPSVELAPRVDDAATVDVLERLVLRRLGGVAPRA